MDNKGYTKSEEASRNLMDEHEKYNQSARRGSSRSPRNDKNLRPRAGNERRDIGERRGVSERRDIGERRGTSERRSTSSGSSYNRGDNPWGREGSRRGGHSGSGKKGGGGVAITIALVLIILVIVGVAAAGYMFLDRTTPEPPTEEMANFNLYFGIQNAEDIAVIIDSLVISGEATGTGGRIFDGEVYLDISIVNRKLNHRFYWDNNEQLMIHTLPNGHIKAGPNTREYTDHGEARGESFDIIRTDRGNTFIALSFVQRFANIEYNLYKDPDRLVITTQWGEREVTSITRDTFVRVLAGPMALVLRDIGPGEEVFFIEDEGYWRKIATFDGFIGYVRDDAIDGVRTETFNRAFEEPVFTRMTRGISHNVGWDETNSIYDNAHVQETINRSQGLTAIAPMWLSIRDTSGNIDSIATVEYVQTAHQAGLEVWVTLRDFHGGIHSPAETYEVLSRTSSRRQIIDQTIAETLRVGADGINLDLEKVPPEASAHWVQFVREMSVECRAHGIVLSVANFYPNPWWHHYNLAEQARVVDYVMLMGYDQYYEGSRSSGPVASFEFVRSGIELSLQYVPAEMLINAIPFYSRLWYEVPMTEDELAVSGGYATHVSSIALGMNLSMSVMLNSGVEKTWDPETRMYFASWSDPYGQFRMWLEASGVNTAALLPPAGGFYRMWLECERSLREKLQIMREFNLAGVAHWRLGLESAETWGLINEFF
jgi:spore germination protein YaaH